MFLNSHLLADCGHNKDTLHCSNLFVGETLAGWQWYGYDGDDNDHVDDGTLFDFLCDNPPMPTYLPFSPCVQHLQQFLSVGIFLVRFPNPHYVGEPD